jgi:transcriptional regulator with XRE-family HTH domain
MKYQNQFGRAFRTVRLAKGLTQEDFANESGRTYVSELERGLKQPTLQKIDHLVEPLGLHPLTPLFLAYLHDYDPSSVESLLSGVREELNSIFSSVLLR